MVRCLLLLPALLATAAAFCPDFFQNQTLCSCYDYIDGAVVKCSGQDSPQIVEKLKQTHHELRELTIENSNIVEIGAHAFKNLRIKKLVLDKNRIRKLHKDAFKGLENVLMDLSLAHNNFSEVPTEALSSLRALNILNMKCNRIANLTGTPVPKLSNLIDIDFSCNNICSIEENVFENVRDSLQNLILDNNCLVDFPSKAVQNMERLIAFHAKYNKINEIGEGALTNMSSLSMLTLTANNISTIHHAAVDNSPNLHYLYIGENSIKQFDSGVMAQFKQLQVLDLSFNFFEEVREETLAGLESLQHINLDSNIIKEIAPKAFEGKPLLLLWLPNNCLTSLTPQMFQGAPFLRQISLANNNIKQVQSLTFAHLANLNHLDMASNKMLTVDQNTFAANDHLTVRLQENPLVCQGADGFHVINGAEAVNLTTEKNLICQTNWRENTVDLCPKAQPRPAAPPCCGRKVRTTVAPTTTTPMTTTEEMEETTTVEEKSAETKSTETETSAPKSSEKSVEEAKETSEKTEEKTEENKKTMGEHGVDEEEEQEEEVTDNEEEEEEEVEEEETTEAATSSSTTTITTTTTTTEAPTTTTEEEVEETTTKKTVNMDRFNRLRNPKFALRTPSKKTKHQPSYLKAVTEAPKEEEEDEEEEGEYEEDDEEEEEESTTAAPTTTTKSGKRIPFRVQERNKLRNMKNLPPWMGRSASKESKETTPAEEFNKDGAVETVQVDQPAQ